uniref:Tudor domain-containing protein Tdr28 n=1 Tax=Locusta migratoria TaxID=7004 RepID=A0AAU7J948_LOCMI
MTVTVPRGRSLLRKPKLDSIMARRKFCAKNSDPMDQWLESHGFYRKHTARDGSCLFRAVSEQIFFTQAAHKIVRKHCTDYLLRQRMKFSKFVEGSFDDYVKKMRNVNEAGGTLELQAIAEFYRRDVHIFQQIGKPPIPLTKHGYQEQIVLCYSSETHYDSVYLNSYINNAGFCQSIVYTILYSNVFLMNDVSTAVEIMLRKSVTAKKKNFADFEETESLNVFTNSTKSETIENDELLSNMKYLIACGLVPFPYKVAKALDANIYRNVEFDAWSDMKRDKKYGILQGNELGEGVRCLVKLNPDKLLYAYIQHMEPDEGPVIVYVEDLAKMCTVEYSQLEPLPKNERPPVPQPTRRIRVRNVLQKLALNAAYDYGTKLKKTRASKPRKVKDDLCRIQSPSISSTLISPKLSLREEKRCSGDQLMTSQCHINYSNYQVANCSPSHAINFQANGSIAQLPVLGQDTSRTQDFCSSQHVSSTQILIPATTAGGYHPECSIGQERGSSTAKSPPPEPDSTTPTKPSAILTNEVTVSASETVSQTVLSPNHVACSCCPGSSCLKTNPVYVLSPSVQFVSHLPPRVSEATEDSVRTAVSGPPVKGMMGNVVQALNLVAQKSVLPDGSDLPLHDIQTLRFYYNLGCDWFRQSCLPLPVHIDSYTGSLATPAAAAVAAAAPPPPPPTSPENEVSSTVPCHSTQSYTGHLQQPVQQKFTEDTQGSSIILEHGCENSNLSSSPVHTVATGVNQPCLTVYNTQYMPVYPVDTEAQVVPISVPYFHYPVAPNIPLAITQETETKTDSLPLSQSSNSTQSVPAESSFYPGYAYYNIAASPYIVHPGALYQRSGILPQNASPKWNMPVSFHQCPQYS